MEEEEYEWRILVMGLVEFLRDCGAGNCSHHNVFFTNFCRGKRKLKKILFSKKLQKAERPGDHIRDCAFYDLVDEI